MQVLQQVKSCGYALCRQLLYTGLQLTGADQASVQVEQPVFAGEGRFHTDGISFGRILQEPGTAAFHVFANDDGIGIIAPSVSQLGPNPVISGQGRMIGQIYMLPALRFYRQKGFRCFLRVMEKLACGWLKSSCQI